MPQLNPLDWGPQLIWLFLTFGILYLLMVWIAIPRIGSVIDKRAAKIAGDIDAAEKGRRDTEAAIAAYEQALAEAKQKAHGIVEAGRTKLKAETDAKRAKLDAQLAAESEAAAAEIDKAKEAAMRDVNTVASDVATDIVKQLIGIAPPKTEIDKAVAAARKA